MRSEVTGAFPHRLVLQLTDGRHRQFIGRVCLAQRDFVPRLPKE